MHQPVGDHPPPAAAALIVDLLHRIARGMTELAQAGIGEGGAMRQVAVLVGQAQGEAMFGTRTTIRPDGASAPRMSRSSATMPSGGKCSSTSSMTMRS